MSILALSDIQFELHPKSDPDVIVLYLKDYGDRVTLGLNALSYFSIERRVTWLLRHRVDDLQSDAVRAAIEHHSQDIIKKIGKIRRIYDIATLWDRCPGLLEVVESPCDGKKDVIFQIIQDLNDVYQWSREQIADWLESLDIDLAIKGKT